MAEDQDEASCVIVHFNAEWVIFAFSNDASGEEEDAQMGIVKPSNVKVGTKCIPGNVKKIDTLSKYLEVGDELICTVVRKEGLKKLIYPKQGSDGKCVDEEIKPCWLAISAVKVDPSDEEQKEAELENPFYSKDSSSEKDDEEDEDDDEEEEEENIGEDEPLGSNESLTNTLVLPEPVSTSPSKNTNDLILPEPVKAKEKENEVMNDNEANNTDNRNEIASTKNTQLNTEEQKSGNEDDMDLDEDMLELEVNKNEFEELGGQVEEKDEDEDVEIIIGESNRKKGSKDTIEFKVPLPIGAAKTKESEPENFNKNKDENISTETIKNPVLALDDDDEETFLAKLVQFNKSSSVKLKGKVTSGILEILDGEHQGKRGLFQVASCYVWGHHLANANLMYSLRAGDKFIVKVTLKSGAVEDMEVPLIIKKCWIGVKSSDPLEALKSVDFSAWLIERSLPETEFLKWVQDQLPPKPFFPLKSELFEAKVIMLIRENPKGDGALVRVTKEGDMKDNLAVFERDDFYICGVHVGEADMRFLIRPGDSLTIQLKELSEREKKAKIKKYPKLDEFEFNHSCLLAYIGESRPRGPNMKPEDSPELKQFLDGKGMNIQEFSQMKESPEPDELVTSTKKVDQPPVNTAQGMLPSPMNWLVNPPPVVGMYPPPILPPMIPTMPFPAPCTSIPPVTAEAGAGPNMDKITKCSALVAKAVMMGNAKDSRISELLKTEEDIENGFFLAQMFTSALVANVQGHLKEKLKAKVGSSYGEVLSSMNRQLDMSQRQLLNSVSQKDIIQAAATTATVAQKPMSQAMLLAQQSTLASLPPPEQTPQPVQEQPKASQEPMQPFHMNIVNQYEKQQQEAMNDFSTSKGLLAMSDMKKRLEAFKAAKKIDKRLSTIMQKKEKRTTRAESPDIIEVNDNSQFRWDDKEALEEKSMSPLELLRKYTIMKRPVEIKGSNVFFREISFPKDCKTNLKINKASTTEGPEYYTLGCLVTFLKYRDLHHPEYVRKCISEDKTCVRRPDRVNVTQYLTGAKDFILNLENLTHRQLNPGLFGDEDRAQSGEYGGEYGGGTSEYGGGGDQGMNKAELLTEQWKKKHIVGSQERDQRNSASRDSRSSEIERRRGRSRSRERMRRSRSRDRRKRSRSRSNDRNRRSRSRSREKRRRSKSRSTGRNEKYDPFEQTLSPTKHDVPTPPTLSTTNNGRNQFDQSQRNMFQQGSRQYDLTAGFAGHNEARGLGSTGFSQPFDQRPQSMEHVRESPFDQRHARSDMGGFNQRSGLSDQMGRDFNPHFDRRQNTPDQSVQNMHESQNTRRSRFDQEPDTRRSRFDQEPEVFQRKAAFGQQLPMRNHSQFDQEQRPNQIQFGQQLPMNNQSRFDEEEAPRVQNQAEFGQQLPSRSSSRFDDGSWGNQNRMSPMDAMNRNSSRFEEEEQQHSSMNDSRFMEQKQNFGQNPRMGHNFNDFSEQRNMMRGNQMNQGRYGDDLNGGQGSYGQQQPRPGEGNGGGGSALGPMFVIGSQGQGQNMQGSSEPRRW